MGVSYYWPDIGQTVADAVALEDDVQDDSTRMIAVGIADRNHLTNRDLWGNSERSLAIIRDGVESRWTVEADETVEFCAHEDRASGSR